MSSDHSNPDFQLAARFVNQTGRSVFLTGKAGTGKTTFLQFIRENTFKKLAVVAPTGVAAINAGGTTMHSFFQLPFGPFVPAPQYGWNAGRSGATDPNSLFANIRFNANKRELLQELELLIIDEISMVRADMLDAVDTILRHFRQQPLAPFGGVQVLYIGDLFQLPPVISQEEWQLLKEYYNSPFFFDAKVIREQPPIYIELKKIYRQNEAVFIDILHNIRNNRATSRDLEKLHDHYQPDFMPPRDSNYITLTSHNARAEYINQAELARLGGKLHTFEATVTGDFNDKAYPAEKTLQLKEGAQIMLIKNDKGETRRYFNGKIGTIKKIGEKITIRFPNEPDDLILEKETWKNIRYQYNKETDKIEEEELGTFSQYPIRLAWAITIHKSQGLTFDKAVIDAGQSFAPGQVYVALSRLRSIDGLVLQSRIQPSSISTDPRVIEYTGSRMSDSEVLNHLQQEQHTYIHHTLQKTFDWSRLTASLQDHHAACGHRQIPARIKAITLSVAWLEKSIHQQETAQKFSRQLDVLLYTAQEDGYRQLQQRMQAAGTWFIQSLEEQLQPLQQHIEEVRIQKKIKKYLAELQELKAMFTRKKQQLEEALQMVDGLQKGLDTTQLLSGLQEARKNREIPTSTSIGTTTSTATATTATGVPATSAAPGKTPSVRGKTSSAPGKTPKGETHRISLHLYKAGISITEIAARRNLAVTTVEGHLASFIPTGEIDLKELVPEDKIETIRTTFRELGNTTLNALKARLGDQYSFGEIRAVLAAIRGADNSSPATPTSDALPQP